MIMDKNLLKSSNCYILNVVKGFSFNLCLTDVYLLIITNLKIILAEIYV